MRKFNTVFVWGMVILSGIMTINIAQVNRLTKTQIKTIETNAARNACIIKESLGYDKLPDRTPTEIIELKALCRDILNGDALGLVRRVHERNR